MRKTKKEIWDIIYKTSLMILGSIILSFGNLAFMSVCDINAGGSHGIAIIFRYFIGGDASTQKLTYNLAIVSYTVVCWFLGWFLIGKEFALKTLVASIAFPAANFAFTYIPGLNTLISDIANSSAGELINGTYDTGNIMLCSIYGGVCVGTGVAITFIGGGSTGGSDVLTFLFEKYLHIKQSIASFIVDGSVILIGIILLPNKHLVSGLCGAVSAFVVAALIDFIFINNQSGYQLDIISDKWEEISRFAQDELGRGATILHVEGGYKQEDRIMLRVVFDKQQYDKIRDFITLTDPKAFMTITRTNAVYGEGFKMHELSAKEKIKQKKNNKDGK